jgi:hypothetical protein
MIKNIFTVVFRSLPILAIVSFFSCWSPFEPVTNIGKDVVTGIDPDATNLKSGFRVIDSMDLRVQDPRSLTAVGHDTSRYLLHAGDDTTQFSAGRFGDDSAVAYAEFQMSFSDLSKIRTGCKVPVDSVRLLLYYDTTFNNARSWNPFVIQVFSCARKFYPGVRNEIGIVDNFRPCTTLAISPKTPAAFAISLGADMVARLNRAVADSSGKIRYPDKIDTSYGKLKIKVTINPAPQKPDTVFEFGPDTVFHRVIISKTDTLLNLPIDKVVDPKPVFEGDTTIVNFKALHYDTIPGKYDTSFVVDTLLKFHADSIINLQPVFHTNATIISYTALYYDAIHARYDTTYNADTLFNFHTDSIIDLKRAFLGDTATIISFSALQDFVKNDTTSIADTLLKFHADSLVGLNPVFHADTTIFNFTALHYDTLSARFDTGTFANDSSSKFIGAVSMHGPGDGIVHFGTPFFQVKNCTDTNWTPIKSTYHDMCVTEASTIANDSLVASWQADRFVEIPINMQPMWDTTKTGNGKDFKIVQDASCILDSVGSLFEGLERNDTVRTVLYGLLDHSIAGTKAQSMGTRDSLKALASNGRSASFTVGTHKTQHILPMTMYLQSLVDHGKPPTAYLYFFVNPATHFGRVIFKNKPTIRFKALFSNSHK